jgi:hypothetical protein
MIDLQNTKLLLLTLREKTWDSRFMLNIEQETQSRSERSQLKPRSQTQKKENRRKGWVRWFVCCYLVDQDAQKSSHCQEGKDAQYELQSHALFGRCAPLFPLAFIEIYFSSSSSPPNCWPLSFSCCPRTLECDFLCLCYYS